MSLGFVDRVAVFLEKRLPAILCLRAHHDRVFAGAHELAHGFIGVGRHIDFLATGDPRDVRQRYHPGGVSHGVVASTPSELAQFIDRLFAGQLVSADPLDRNRAASDRDHVAASTRRWSRRHCPVA